MELCDMLAKVRKPACMSAFASSAEKSEPGMLIAVGLLRITDKYLAMTIMSYNTRGGYSRRTWNGLPLT